MFQHLIPIFFYSLDQTEKCSTPRNKSNQFKPQTHPYLEVCCKQLKIKTIHSNISKHACWYLAIEPFLKVQPQKFLHLLDSTIIWNAICFWGEHFLAGISISPCGCDVTDSEQSSSVVFTHVKKKKSQHGQTEVRAQVGVALDAKPQSLTWWIMCLWQFSHLSWIFFQHKKKQTRDKAKARYLELCVLCSNLPDVTTRQTFRKFSENILFIRHIQIFNFNSLHWSSRATEF